MTSNRQSTLGEKQECPPRQSRWQGHTMSVVSLQVVDHFQRRKYILSASIDCTAKLWTVDGVPVGMFSQVS